MKYRAIAAVIVVVSSGISTSATAQRAPLAAADIAKIKNDVEAAARNYVKLFSARDTKAISETVFTNPSFVMGSNGPNVMTPEKLVASYTKQFEELAKTPYDHSILQNPTVCVMSANSAIVGGTFQRINHDGSLLMEISTSYLYTKTSDGWRLVTVLGGQKNKPVTCD